MIICKKCGCRIKWKEILEEFNYLFERADYYGTESLTENEQMIFENKWCSKCYKKEEEYYDDAMVEQL